MKEIRRNMRLIGTLILCLFIGTGGWFGYTAFTQGSRWAMSGSSSQSTCPERKRAFRVKPKPRSPPSAKRPTSC